MPDRCRSCQPAALNFLQHAPAAWIFSQPLSGRVTARALWNPDGGITPERVGSREMEQRARLRSDGISVVLRALHGDGNIGWR